MHHDVFGCVIQLDMCFQITFRFLYNDNGYDGVLPNTFNNSHDMFCFVVLLFELDLMMVI